jgi:hypothetical protein
VPAGAVPKDGPSAGVTMAAALVSALSKRRAHGEVAMTGEISLRGRVLPVGGIKDKVLAASRAGIRTVLCRSATRRTSSTCPSDVREALDLRLVESLDQVLATGARAGTPSSASASSRAGVERPREPWCARTLDEAPALVAVVFEDHAAARRLPARLCTARRSAWSDRSDGRARARAAARPTRSARRSRAARRRDRFTPGTNWARRCPDRRSTPRRSGYVGARQARRERLERPSVGELRNEIGFAR